MNITSGITAKAPDESFRKLSVSLDWNDLLRLVDEGKVPGWKLDTRLSMLGDGTSRIVVVNDDGQEMPVTTAWDWLRRWGDRLLIVHMAREGLLSGESALAQIRELGFTDVG